MDSSDLTKNKRNRVTANSLNGRIALRHSNITMSSDVLSSYILGSKRVTYNKIRILPSCSAPECKTDEE